MEQSQSALNPDMEEQRRRTEELWRELWRVEKRVYEEKEREWEERNQELKRLQRKREKEREWEERNQELKRLQRKRENQRGIKVVKVLKRENQREAARQLQQQIRKLQQQIRIVKVLKRENQREAARQLQQLRQQRWHYSSSTKKVNIQSSDGRGQVTKVSYEDIKVRSHVTSENVREGKVDKVKVTTQKGSQGHKKQEPVIKSAETTLYATTSKEDISTSSGLSSTPSTSGQPQASAFSPQTLPPPLAPPAAAAPPSRSPPPPEPRDEVTQLAQKLLKAVKRKKSDQDSLNVLSEQLGGSVIVIKKKTVNNHYHYHNHNNTCEEVRLEKSDTVNVCVGGPLKVYQRPPQDDDNGDENAYENIHGTDSNKEKKNDEDNHDHTMNVDMDNKNTEK